VKGLPALAFDTPVWIHWVEQNRRFLPAVAPLVTGLAEGRIVVVTSILAILEILTGVFARGDELRAHRYRDIFDNTEGVAVLEVDRAVAEGAARLRARYRLKTPDAIHLATALAARASVFVTTDRRLARVREVEVRILRPVTARVRGGKK
jgi:predicted nucleic acid-binding protein